MFNQISNKFPLIILLVLSLSLLAFKSLMKENEVVKSVHPNVIFVLADQWRSEAIGYAGNNDVITPNLDRLSK